MPRSATFVLRFSSENWRFSQKASYAIAYVPESFRDSPAPRFIALSARLPEVLASADHPIRFRPVVGCIFRPPMSKIIVLLLKTPIRYQNPPPSASGMQPGLSPIGKKAGEATPRRANEHTPLPVGRATDDAPFVASAKTPVPAGTILRPRRQARRGRSTCHGARRAS